MAGERCGVGESGRRYSRAAGLVGRGPSCNTIASLIHLITPMHPHHDSGRYPGTKRAIILAAGKGRRLFPVTDGAPKPLAEVAGKQIIANLVDTLISNHVCDIVIVAGYRAAELESALAPYRDRARLTFVANPNHATTNNVLSLWLAREYFDEDFLLLEADIYFKPSLLVPLCRWSGASNAAVISPLTRLMDGACVRIEGAPFRISPPEPQRHYKADDSSLYKTVNIYRISSETAAHVLLPRLDAAVRQGRVHGYYEEVFADAIRDREVEFAPVVWEGADWYEVDNLDDLAIADYMFALPDRRQAKLRAEHGGFWRYPVVDHCLLYNCHYPPEAAFDHLRSRLELLVRHYPAGQTPIASFAAQYYGLPSDTVLIGNGVSEFIRALGRVLEGRLLLPSPSFDEYETMVSPDHLVRFPLSADQDFAFPTAELIESAIRLRVSQLVIVSPNNPTGVVMPLDDLEALLVGLREQAVRVIFDDSFLDFSDASSSERALGLLERFPNLVLVRSLSKSHGIAGARLGLLACSDRSLIRAMRSELPIWNINSVAEQYLRIMGAFRQEYLDSCRLVRDETRKLAAELARLPGVRVFPTGANFVLCELSPSHAPAREVARVLLARHGILVKDCSSKKMLGAERYLRIASRTTAENARLVSALEELLPPPAAGVRRVRATEVNA